MKLQIPRIDPSNASSCMTSFWNSSYEISRNNQMDYKSISVAWYVTIPLTPLDGRSSKV